MMSASKTILAVLLAGASLCGCAYPASSISQGAEDGHLRFQGPAGARIRIDSQDRGVIADGRATVIDVSPGRHRVEESAGGHKIVDQPYEVGAGSTLDIGGTH